jgi:kinesin family protein 6/9
MSGAETWQLRGIIPRVLSVKKKLFYLIQFIFDEIDRKTNVDYSVYISFMEIYNENAYDLLEKKHLELPME